MPRRWCSGGCGRLVVKPATQCDACARARRARSEAGRLSRRERGYDAEYDRNRRVVVGLAFQMADAGTPAECVLCFRPCLRGQNLTAEHLVPLRKGGSSELVNLGPAHSGCNSGWRRRSA